jgi:large subunit ribosomal protein L19
VSQELLKKASAKSLKADLPKFEVGDTVTVSVKIVEGEKERVQAFRGTVIRRQGRGIGETFTVRRIVANEGVERTFPLHSPQVVGVEVVRSGRTRRSKLFFLRKRVGRSTRLRDARESAGGSARSKAEGEASEDAAEADGEQ